MMITLSMWLHSIVSNEVSAALQTKILILVAKKNTLKATKTDMFFVHILSRTQIHQSPVWCSDTTQKNLWRNLRWQFWAIWTGQIWKLCPLGTNHVGAFWVTKLVESMNKWPTIFSKLISTTEIGFKLCH